MERPGPYLLHVLVAVFCVGWMAVQLASPSRETRDGGGERESARVLTEPESEELVPPPAEEVSRRVPAAVPEAQAASLHAETPARRAQGNDQATLDVLVLDPSSRPVRGAWVEIGREAERPLLRRTGPDGHLRIQLGPGSVRLVARDATQVGGPEHLELEVGDRPSVAIHLTAGREVAGRVIDAETGEPLAGAAVSFWTFSETDRVLTAADGTFRHPRFPGDAVAQQVRIEAPGHGASVRYLRIRADGTWKLLASTPDSPSPSGTGSPWLEILLVRELEISGTIVGPDSRPIESATVSAEGFFHVLPTVASRDGADTQTLAAGEFVLAGLRADIGHSLIVRAPGFAEHIVEVPADAVEHLDVGQIRLEREALLVGVVVDAEGHPVVDIEVLLTPRDDAGRQMERTPRTTGASDVPVRVEGFEERVRTGVDGTFLFDHLRERPYELRVLRDNEALITLDLDPVPGQGFPALELGLPFQSLTMTGSVSGPDGPLADARVELERFGSVAVATTDREGHFRIAGLDDFEAYAVRVTALCPRTGSRLTGSIEAWGFESPQLVLSAR